MTIPEEYKQLRIWQLVDKFNEDSPKMRVCVETIIECMNKELSYLRKEIMESKQRNKDLY